MARKVEASRKLQKRAEHLIPGGVNSPVRAFGSVGGDPLFIVRGQGSHLWDADENKYIDYVGSWGPLILGHAVPSVVEEARGQFVDRDAALRERGLRVTGSEIVGMVPKKCLIDAGKHFLQKQNWSEGLAEEELIDLALRSMGLSELKPFDPKEKVIELKIEAAVPKKSMVKLDLRRFCNETLSDSPAPGGGSVAALMGALGASLGGMVANLSAGKRGWEDKLRYFSDWAVKAQQLKDEMLLLVDEDTAAFNKVMAAFALPKGSAKERSARTAAIQAANKLAAEVPLRIMQTASKAYDLLAEMAARGNPASISDVGVGLLAVHACIDGAGMNVRINLANLKDEKIKSAFSDKLHVFSGESDARFKEISKVVEKKFR